MSEILEKIKSIEPRNYAASISRAILHFLRDRDTNAALKELKGHSIRLMTFGDTAKLFICL